MKITSETCGAGNVFRDREGRIWKSVNLVLEPTVDLVCISATAEEDDHGTAPDNMTLTEHSCEWAQDLTPLGPVAYATEP